MARKIYVGELDKSFEFPDGTSDEEIDRLVDSEILPSYKPLSTLPVPRGSFDDVASMDLSYRAPKPPAQAKIPDFGASFDRSSNRLAPALEPYVSEYLPRLASEVMPAATSGPTAVAKALGGDYRGAYEAALAPAKLAMTAAEPVVAPLMAPVAVPFGATAEALKPNMPEGTMAARVAAGAASGLPWGLGADLVPQEVLAGIPEDWRTGYDEEKVAAYLAEKGFPDVAAALTANLAGQAPYFILPAAVKGVHGELKARAENPLGRPSKADVKALTSGEAPLPDPVQLRFEHASAVKAGDFSAFDPAKAGSGEGANIPRAENLELSQLGPNVFEVAPDGSQKMGTGFYAPLVNRGAEGVVRHDVSGRLDLKPSEILDREEVVPPSTRARMAQNGVELPEGATGADAYNAIREAAGGKPGAMRDLYLKSGVRSLTQAAEETAGQTKKHILLDEKAATDLSHTYFDEAGNKVPSPFQNELAQAKARLKANEYKGAAIGGDSLIHPEKLNDILTVGIGHFRDGATTVMKWAQKMVSDLGSWVKPVLAKVWAKVKDVGATVKEGLLHDERGAVPSSEVSSLLNRVNRDKGKSSLGVASEIAAGVSSDLKNGARKFREALADRYAPAIDFYNELTGTKKSPPSAAGSDFRNLVRLMDSPDRSIDQTLHGYFKPHSVERAGQGVAPLFVALKKDSRKASTQATLDMEDVLIAETTLERASRDSESMKKSDNNRLTGIGLGTGKSDVAVAYEVLDATKKWSPERRAQVQKATLAYRSVASEILDMLQDYQILGPEDVARIKSSNTMYADLHRVMDDASPGWQSGGSGPASGIRNAVRKFRGSARTINSPTANLLQQYDATAKLVSRKVAMDAFRDAFVGKDGSLTEMSDRLGVRRLGEGEKSRSAITLPEIVDGKKVDVRYELPPDVYAALTGQNKLKVDIPVLSAVARGMATIKRIGVTMAPAFKIMNIARDSFERSILTDVGGGPWESARLTQYSDSLRRLKESGGSQSGFGLRDTADFNKMVPRLLREAAGDKRNIIVRGVEGMKWLSDLSEQSNRTAEYRLAYDKAIKQGATPYNAQVYAAAQARSLLDFSRAGTVMQFVNQYVPFSNASIQGAARAVKAFKEHPGRSSAAFSAYILVPKLVEYLVNQLSGDYDELRQQPAYLRDYFLSFKVGPDKWLRIPMGYSFAPMASGATRLIDYMRGDKAAFSGYGRSVTQAAMPVDPQFIYGPMSSLLEIQANYDMFTGRPIVGRHEENLALSKRKGAANASDLSQETSAVLQKLGVEMDPRYMDHFLKAQFGHMGRYAVTWGQDKTTKGEAFQKMSGLLVDSPGYSARDVQFVLDYFSKEGIWQNQEIKDFKALMSNAEGEKDAVKADRLKKLLIAKARVLRKAIEKRQSKAGVTRG